MIEQGYWKSMSYNTLPQLVLESTQRQWQPPTDKKGDQNKKNQQRENKLQKIYKAPSRTATFKEHSVSAGPGQSASVRKSSNNTKLYFWSKNPSQFKPKVNPLLRHGFSSIESILTVNANGDLLLPHQISTFSKLVNTVKMSKMANKWWAFVSKLMIRTTSTINYAFWSAMPINHTNSYA